VTKTYFIGVDGGATKCSVRLEDEAGNVLGHAISGPANIRISALDAWRSIHTALEKICLNSTITLNRDVCQIHAGVGIAGCEIEAAYQAFIQTPHPFNSLIVIHDAEAACLGAHGGKDGALIIAGTGVAGFQLEAGKTAKVAGWGFPQDDAGSGAWLGLQAVAETLRWQDGRKPASILANSVLAHFEHQLDQLVNWANQANSTAFAELAPLVIQTAQAGDAAAQQLLQAAANEIDLVGAALQAKQNNSTRPLPCAMMGGIAPFLLPYLSDALRARLTNAQLPPEAGAILYARAKLANAREMT
jgi:glucosamine kinase